MNTLQDAWLWYQGTRAQLRFVERLGEKHWDQLPWEKGLDKDKRFRERNGDEVEREAKRSLSYLGDLAIVVLFSVFEALVRQHVLDEIRAEVDALRHRALVAAAEEAQRRIGEGSFFHVLEPYKNVDAALVEEVHQVRRYRNWVAHGRKGPPRENVTPDLAFDRLNRFLSLLAPPLPMP